MMTVNNQSPDELFRKCRRLIKLLTGTAKHTTGDTVEWIVDFVDELEHDEIAWNEFRSQCRALLPSYFVNVDPSQSVDSCLTLEEMDAAVDKTLTSERRTHVSQCAYCGLALATYEARLVQGMESLVAEAGEMLRVEAMNDLSPYGTVTIDVVNEAGHWKIRPRSGSRFRAVAGDTGLQKTGLEIESIEESELPGLVVKISPATGKITAFSGQIPKRFVMLAGDVVVEPMAATTEGMEFERPANGMQIAIRLQAGLRTELRKKLSKGDTGVLPNLVRLATFSEPDLEAIELLIEFSSDELAPFNTDVSAVQRLQCRRDCIESLNTILERVKSQPVVEDVRSALTAMETKELVPQLRERLRRLIARNSRGAGGQ